MKSIILREKEICGLLETSQQQVIRRPVKLRLRPRDDFEIKSMYPDGGGNWIAWDYDRPGLAEFTLKAYPGGEGFPCPFGKAGEQRWVRETWGGVFFDGDKYILQWRDVPKEHRTEENCRGLFYKAGNEPDPDYEGCYVPSSVMPRWASRLTIKVIEVKAEYDPKAAGWVWVLTLEKITQEVR